ncbi:MAG: glutamine--tRNA ligase/YqeY domain fusion protein [Planctomycetes bacterium]|nr:glutamine--tRNA ligase/YqeY domain fusion protein [Planctomycetota bacterium]
MPDPTPPAERPLNFIEQIIEADNAAKKWGTRPDGTPRVHTRFPPEPNGYLHIGHAKSICLNYGLAARYGGRFNLRFDDTNPAKEEQEYVDAIKADVRWLTSAFGEGHSFDAGPHAGGLYWASDYFQQMYDYAVALIKAGKAYVCELNAEEVAKRRGSPSVPATSPFRDRPAEESLRLFDEMRAGKHPDGSMTLRARIDLASPNFNLRDPVLYRILHEEHHNTGRKWCIYPMYDWAHGIEDSLENVTHSICTLEFENHRPLYDWFMREISAALGGARGEGEGTGPSSPGGRAVWHSQQIEFAKFRPTYTVLSKRNLLKMVQDKLVSGWDDPRMPTISGLRRRGYTPRALRAVCEEVGTTKVESFIDLGRIENAVRDHLNKIAPRAMGVLRPLKVVIENWPKGTVEELDFVINPEDPGAGTRKVPFSGTLYIEREDFMEVPAKKYFRLALGDNPPEVRLRWAYFIRATGVVKDADGNVTEVRATYDPATRGGDAPDGRKVKGTIHWVSAEHARQVEVRLFDRMFSAEQPGERTGNWIDDLNPNSLETVRAMVEPIVATAKAGDVYQFERLGYFTADRDSAPGAPVFNRTVTLKDTWAKAAAKE